MQPSEPKSQQHLNGTVWQMVIAIGRRDGFSASIWKFSMTDCWHAALQWVAQCGINHRQIHPSTSWDYHSV